MIKINQRHYLKATLTILLVLLLTFMTAFVSIPVKAETDELTSVANALVDNSSSMSTDTVYQIVTDRFVDGDPSNNPSGEIYDKNNLRKYHGGDWAGITQTLNSNYFTNMGITALWISAPVENNGHIDPSNGCAAYHGYWAKDFFKCNPYFGTKAEFQLLVNTAHSKGIKVIIDFAPNHTSFAVYDGQVQPEDGVLNKNGVFMGNYSNDTNGLFNHVSDDWAEFDTWEHTVYASLFGLADLNQQNAVVDQYLKDAIKVWLDAGVDGIRVDAVKHMSPGWQKNWTSSVYDYKPVFMFGEWYHDSINSEPQMENFANESGMSLLDFRYNKAARSVFAEAMSSGKTMVDFKNTIDATAVDFDEVNDQVTFLDNHDMPRFMTAANNNALTLDLAYAVQMTSRGVPCVYYGSEQYMQDAANPEGKIGDPWNRADMVSFNQNSNAYKIIGKLAPLRKSNPAIAYGETIQRWINNDVYVYERVFGNNKVLTAVNRNQSTGYQLTNLTTGLPNGTYSDVLQNMLGGGNITVSSGAVSPYFLGAGQCAVWQYTAESESAPVIGNINPKMSKPGNTVNITGSGFGSVAGNVKFGVTAASIVSWTDGLIKVKVPTVAGGRYNVTVTNSSGVASDAYSDFNVLSGTQTSVRFKVNNAYTAMGESVYIVGSTAELGNWDVSKAIGPIFNDTLTIGKYPTWFYDISVPANTQIEFKFVKINSAGTVTWEGGNNHMYTTPLSNTGEIVVNWQ